MLKLGRVTKVKVLFLVLVFVFNFDLFKFSAAILEKGLLETTSITVDKIIILPSKSVCIFYEFLVFKFISQSQKTGGKTESCGNLLKLDLSE